MTARYACKSCGAETVAGVGYVVTDSHAFTPDPGNCRASVHAGAESCYYCDTVPPADYAGVTCPTCSAAW